MKKYFLVCAILLAIAPFSMQHTSATDNVNVARIGYYVYIRAANNKHATCYCEPSIKIIDFKLAYVEIFLGIPAEKQKLIYNGKQLEDDKSLADYNIMSGSTINVIIGK